MMRMQPCRTEVEGEANKSMSAALNYPSKPAKRIHGAALGVYDLSAVRMLSNASRKMDICAFGGLAAAMRKETSFLTAATIVLATGRTYMFSSPCRKGSALGYRGTLHQRSTTQCQYANMLHSKGPGRHGPCDSKCRPN